jgi:hypothetical protein
MITLGPAAQDFLMRGYQFAVESHHHVGASSFVGILDAVRNIILEWSLKLEEQGIIGNGMSFSKGERDKAKESAAVLQSIVNNITIHSMTNSSIQQGSERARQKRTG